MAKIDVGTVYDWARAEMNASQKKPMIKTVRRAAFINIGEWLSATMNTKYYMLLNNERRDYTIFNFINFNYTQGVQELEEVIDSRGELINIEYNHELGYYEIWIKIEDVYYVYLFFECDDFVIEVK